MVEQYYLLGKDKKHRFSLPEGWRVLANAALEAGPISRTVAQMTTQALESPIGAPPLKESLDPRSKVAIIVDDRTRPTPRREMVEVLLSHLNGLGVEDSRIDLVFGLGTHRPLDQEEVVQVLGPEVTARVRIHHHDAWAEDLVPLGRLEHGGELKINRIVAEADLKIAVGSILPHPMNGFGGGAKALMPGVANYDFIRDHHRLPDNAPKEGRGPHA